MEMNLNGNNARVSELMETCMTYEASISSRNEIIKEEKGSLADVKKQLIAELGIKSKEDKKAFATSYKESKLRFEDKEMGEVVDEINSVLMHKKQ